MVVRLLSNSLFNLADNVLHFSGILFSLAVSRQVGVVGMFAGLLSDCAFELVKLACCLIFRAQFRHDSLLCVDAGRFPDLLLRGRSCGCGRRLRLGNWGRGCGGGCLFLRLRLRLVVMATGLLLRLRRLGGLGYRRRRGLRRSGGGRLRSFLRRNRQRKRKHGERHEGRSD